MPVKSKKIDHYEKRFGVVAIDKGFIAADELINGLKVQVQEDVGLGYHRLIGKILLDWGVMSEEQIAEVLNELPHFVYDHVARIFHEIFGLREHTSGGLL